MALSRKMRWYWLAVLSTVLFAGVATAEAADGDARQVESFDDGWRFLQADVAGGEQVNTPDNDWQRVDLPHDWAITAPFLESNHAGGAGAFATYGVGWYRKAFFLSLGARGRKAFVEFDGVMANSDVWVNGVHLGHRPYGYVSFAYDLTPYLHYGPKALNVLAVRADNAKQPASRWYEGAGIYRHVRLVLVNPVHIAQWGAFVSTPHVSADAGEVRVQTEVKNEASAEARVHLAVTILDASGRTVAAGDSNDITIGAGAASTPELALHVARPALWSIESPTLYRAEVRVVSGRRTLDEESVTFGIRDAHFEAATGFWLNGRNIKIKGVALHSDAGSLGMAVPLAAWEHRLAAMKRMGANAIRTAHNPVAPEFLDLCDRMGFLVMDEMFDQWTVAKNPYDYHLYFREWHLADTRDTVRRDRNHPSIIVYSAGNEIHDTPNAELAKSILGPLVAEFHAADPTRPVTQALFRPNASHDYQDGLADTLDVVGQNYRENEILAAHAEKPERKILGTETGHSREAWLALRDHPEYAGQFLWSGTDYLGESRHWPMIGDASGFYDRTDRPKPDGLERESWWSEQPVVHIARRVAPTQKAPTDPGYEAVQYRPAQVVFADWTPADGSPHTEHVEVYSNCESVELFLNGRSLGSLPLNRDASPRRWEVGFEPGTLRAVASDGGRVVASEKLRTAARPDHLLLKVESGRLTPAWDDVAYVRALVVDKDGVEVPDADALLTFSVNGPAKILTTDNGDNADHSGFDRPDRHAYEGEAIAILRATANSGQATITVTGEGLRSASIEVPVGARR